MAKSRYARSRQHWKKERKTVHNQNKPFNPGKYGKVWGAIEFAHDWGRQPEGDANGPVIGKLKIGNQTKTICHLLWWCNLVLLFHLNKLLLI